MATVGVADPRQLLEELPPPSLLQRVDEVPAPGLLDFAGSGCRRRFHVLSLDKTEELAPALQHCLVSTWAAKLHRGLATSPCAGTQNDAELIVLPGYTAVECNWPIYGGGNCDRVEGPVANAARPGSVCRGWDTLEAFQSIQRKLGKPVVVLENSPNAFGNKYDLPDTGVYAAPRTSWALVGADLKHYRRGVDISLPPGPSIRCAASRSLRSFEQRLEDKTFLASFKGGMSMHAFRFRAKALLHDGKKVIIADKDDNRWDFDELLRSSVFSLVLRGDAVMTTRVNEAVCSGGIPVLVTDVWVPPFNETVPFESFGLVHQEDQVSTLRARLEAVSAERRKKLRSAAREACERHFQNIDAHAATLGRAVSGLTSEAVTMC